MTGLEASLPRVALNRAQSIRLAIVGLFVAFALARVVPDAVRTVFPLRVFGYVTDGDGVVIRPGLQPGSAAIALGDRVRIDQIAPFDRKRGLAGSSYTYDNPQRILPVQRAGRLRRLHLAARAESAPSRYFALLRIVLYAISIALGALFFLIKPGIATAGFFVFCLGGDAPTTYLDLSLPNPWRPIPEWIGDTIAGASRTALLLFAFCLIDGDADAPRERVFACICAVAGLVLGSLHAYGGWLLTYAGQPAEHIDRFTTGAADTVTSLTIVAFIVAFVRARGVDRARIGWIVAAFLVAAAARLASDEWYPLHLPAWLNGALVSISIVPIAGVWVAVIRQRLFNVDFVVSRAIVYVALTAAAFGTITAAEEFGTYLFYNNTDLAYGFIIAISLGIGATTGKLKPLVDHLVDRFIFRNRHDARKALELIEGYILDAETHEDVFRALLADAAHALKLSFGGFLMRRPNGDYVLAYAHNWPTDCITRLRAGDELTWTFNRTRGALTPAGKDTAAIARAFPGERMTFAAPVFFDRAILGIVIYGHNISGLDLDPEEREHLVRVVAHASIALSSIELARYRSGSAAPADESREVRHV